MIGVIYEIEEEKTEPKAREIMTGSAPSSAAGLSAKTKKLPVGICSRADGEQEESPEFLQKNKIKIQNKKADARG